MDKATYAKLKNVIKAEAEYILKNETDKETKIQKMDTLFNITKILDNYDELKPILQDFFNKKAQKDKWER